MMTSEPTDTDFRSKRSDEAGTKGKAMCSRQEHVLGSYGP